MNKAVYREPRTYEKYDSNHIIGYLNETVIEDYQPEVAEGQSAVEPYTGYQYEGQLTDGGTIMECSDSTNRGEIVNAIIRSRYPLSEEMAIHRHHQNDPVRYAEEWDMYDAFCEEAKRIANGWLTTEG